MFPKYYNHSDQQEFELVDKFLSTNSKIINVINGMPRFVENSNYDLLLVSNGNNIG